MEKGPDMFMPRTRENKGRKKIFLCLVCFLFIHSAFAHSEIKNSHAGYAGKRVLLLNSYHKGYLWSDEITRGVEETLVQTGIDLHVEYMDTKRQFDEKYQDLLAKLLAVKHTRHPYDAVICSDNNAFEFFNRMGREIFGPIPLVFCGLNSLDKKDFQNRENMTGIIEKANLKGNLALIRKVHPRCRKILVITDDTTTGRQVQGEVKELAKTAKLGDMNLELLYDADKGELIHLLEDLDPGAIVLFTFFSRDRSGDFFEYDEGAELVSRRSPVPVYGAWNFSLGHGIVGGHLVSGYGQGAVAAQKTLSVLSGQKAESIPIQYETPTVLRFDFRQLKRHSIGMGQLPPGSEVLFRPASFYEKHKELIWPASIVFLMLALGLAGVTYGLILSGKAKKNLSRSERNLRTTLNSIGDAVIATDREGGVVQMNPVAERLTGWPIEEALGRPLEKVFHIIHGHTRKPVKNPVQQVLETGKKMELADHTTLISRDGTSYHVADSASPIQSRAGETLGGVMVFRDVTREHDRLDEQNARLERIQAQHEALIKLTGNPAVVSADVEGSIHFITRLVAETLKAERVGVWLFNKDQSKILLKENYTLGSGEHSSGAVLKETDYPLYFKNQIQEWIIAAHDALNDPRTHEFKESYLLPLGITSMLDVALRVEGRTLGILCIEHVGEARTWADDEIAFARAVSDQIDQVFLSRDRKKARQAVEENEKKYKQLFESSMDAILLLDPDKGLTDCNPAAVKMFGAGSKEQMLGLNPADRSSRYQADGRLSPKKAGILIKKIMETGKHSFEWTHKPMDGEKFYGSVIATRMDIGGQTMIQATVRDITDARRAREMMIQTEKMMSVGGLAAGMAHEINNPLAGMMQTADVLAQRLSNKDMPANRKAAREIGISMDQIRTFMEKREILRMTRSIVSSGQRMADIVDNMLSFARKSEKMISSHSLENLMDKTLELAGTDFDLKKKYDFKLIRIRKEVEENLPPVLCERNQIQQVLFNILRNGAQAMQISGTREPEFFIRITREPDREMVCIEIRDNGPGMDEKIRKRIFEPFFTTKPVGEGTGLGLSVSYFIITKSHGGEMEVESSPGTGTCFFVRLPIKRDPF
ncbi:PAS domain S-box protein [Desulfospira joergensenii]|uniref:PAS domain S-box protein n=1 Tax=Desulfospira joergensenii TaxID=53329 RepID=UPI0003B3688E|nr:PAS domain S-box protein [Desulfospira joergensenii]